MKPCMKNPASMMKKALFLDRDGVINIEKNYVYKTEDFEFMDGIFQLVHAAQSNGYLPVIITNQAGIARGYYTEEEFKSLTQWMLNEFSKQGISIARVYHCPFHPEAGLGPYKVDSPDRKPMPGMLLRARDECGLDLAKSILVGDKESDIEAGRNAGVKNLVWLNNKSTLYDAQDVHVFSTLSQIQGFLFGRESQEQNKWSKHARAQ